MGVRVTTKHHVRVRSKIVDHAGTETASAHRGATTLSHMIEVQWLHGNRPVDIRIVSNIIQNASVATYAAPPIPWPADFPQTWASVPRALRNALTVSATLPGQVVFDCGTVEVYDTWKRNWVTDRVPAQLVLTIT